MVNRAIAIFREMPGFEAAYYLGDRAALRVVSIVVFESHSSLKATEQAHAGFRESAGEFGVHFLGIEEYAVMAGATKAG